MAIKSIEDYLVKNRWEFSTMQSTRSQAIKWHLGTQEAWFRFIYGGDRIEVRIPLQEMSEKEWRGKYIRLNSKEEASGRYESDPFYVTFKYEDGIWDGKPSGYACRLHWKVKKISGSIS